MNDDDFENDQNVDLNIEAAKQLEFMADNERKRKELLDQIPSENEEIIKRLRQLEEPIRLFAETDSERHERLKNLIFKLQEKYNDEKNKGKNIPKAETHFTELWYHEGPEELIAARLWIGYYSLCRVQDRLNTERMLSKKPEFEKAAKFQEVQKRFNAFEYRSSQLGDDRPLTYCQVSPDGKSIVTASRSGICKQWNANTLEPIRIFKGHGDHAGAIICHPSLYESDSDGVVQLASCCSAGLVFLWNLKKEEPVERLPDLNHRVSRLAFHPSGRFLASACFDKSWRLYDLQKGMEVLHQEGHSRECFNIAFHSDGSLAVSVGFDARALVWDLRTGRCVLPLDGHLTKIVAVDIAKDGYYVATGSEDQKVIIWDLRMQKCHYTIAAHTNLVSHVKFHDGCLITTSFDKSCRIWSHPGWFPLRTLTGHEQKISCADLSPDQKLLVTTSFDRTFKIWT